MNGTVDLSDLIDAQTVAELLGLAQRESVSLYQRRYPSMPQPLVDLGRGRPMLWSRAQMELWVLHRGSRTKRRTDSIQPRRAVLLDATAKVITDASLSELTMRRVADEAGCSPGLLYHYFDNKEALLGALLEKIGERLAALVPSGHPPRQQLLALLSALEANPAFHRLMTWLVLEGRDVSEFMGRFPVISQAASDAAIRGDKDPALTAGLLAFTSLSLCNYTGLVNHAMGRAAGDDRLREAVADMYALGADALAHDSGSRLGS
jgi:AcrR family transcriptional regulator